MSNYCFSLLTFAFLFVVSPVASQTEVPGFCYEQNNRGFLYQVKISILEWQTNIVKAEIQSDQDGRFMLYLPQGRYRLLATKSLFEDFRDTFDISDAKTYLKLEMQRKPGYLFDATLAEARENPNQVVDAVSGAWIEIYNRTQQKPELVLHNHPNGFFSHTFEQGNHYTILIRKTGFLAKRIEAYVNVKDCILCIDGVRDFSPGVTENLTQGNKIGTLLSNIELERVKVDKRIQIQNIYYDYDKWDIRADAVIQLDNVVQLMRDNPNLSVELGSHTDARGRDPYNLDLSDKRAKAAVAYIIEQGIPIERITAKGYGETRLVNRCSNGITCTDQEHEKNRRTELRITGILEYPEEYWTSLEDLIRREAGNGPLSPTQWAAMRDNRAVIREKPNNTPLNQVRPSSGVPVDISGNDPKSTVISAETAVEIATWNPPFAAFPVNYTGYAIELAQSNSLLPGNSPLLLSHPEIHVRKETNNYCYYILYKNRLDEAYNSFNGTIKSQNMAAKVTSFRSGVKTYLKD